MDTPTSFTKPLLDYPIFQQKLIWYWEKHCSAWKWQFLVRAGWVWLCLSKAPGSAGQDNDWPRDQGASGNFNTDISQPGQHNGEPRSQVDIAQCRDIAPGAGETLIMTPRHQTSGEIWNCRGRVAVRDDSKVGTIADGGAALTHCWELDNNFMSDIFSCVCMLCWE